MAGKAVELGAAFLERLASHLPAEQQEAFRGMVTGNPAVVEELGNGALRMEDYSATRDRQRAWFTEKQKDLTELDRLRAATQGRDNPANPDYRQPDSQHQQQPPVDPNKAPVTFEAARQLEMESINLNATLVTLQGRHMHEFKEPLDCSTLVTGALKAGLNVNDFYRQSVQERRDAAAKATNEAALAAAREEGRLAGRTEIMTQRAGSDIPYPVGSSAPSTLSGLRKDPNAPNQFTLDHSISVLTEEVNRAHAAG